MFRRLDGRGTRRNSWEESASRYVVIQMRTEGRPDQCEQEECFSDVHQATSRRDNG